MLKRDNEWRSAIGEPMAGPWGQARGNLEAECQKTKQGRATVDWDMNKNVK